MAYDPSALALKSGHVYGPHRTWFYKTTDAMTTVRGATYFGDGQARGMQLGDVVEVLVVNGSNVPQTFHIAVVMAISSGVPDLSDGTSIDLTNT